MDAGRVVGPGAGSAGGGGEDAPPPVYEPPPSADETNATLLTPPETNLAAVSRPSIEADNVMLAQATLLSLDPHSQKVSSEVRDLEMGREGLARLRADMVRKQAEKEEEERRSMEEKKQTVDEGREEVGVPERA